jgi:hypothetical protein
MEDGVDSLLRWKESVSKALWILFTAVVGLVIKLVIGE